MKPKQTPLSLKNQIECSEETLHVYNGTVEVHGIPRDMNELSNLQLEVNRFEWMLGPAIVTEVSH
jgi:hypothetical protein